MEFVTLARHGIANLAEPSEILTVAAHYHRRSGELDIAIAHRTIEIRDILATSTVQAAPESPTRIVELRSSNSMVSFYLHRIVRTRRAATLRS